MKTILNNERVDLSKLNRNELEQMVVDLATKLKKEEAKNNWYLSKYKELQHKRFGSSSEAGYGYDGQVTLAELFGDLFNETEAFREMINEEPNPEDFPDADEKKKSKHKGRGKGKNLDNLVTTTETFELSAEEQFCPECGSPLHEVKEEVRTEIEVIPAQTIVHKYVTKVYGCRNCEKKGKPQFIKASGVPLPLMKGSPATASYVAWLIKSKFVDAVPYYRIEQDNKRNGVPITRNNMCNWVARATNDWLQLIFDRLVEILMSKDIIHCDETTLQVLHEPGRDAKTKSYVWVITTGKYDEHNIALYHYTDGRSSAHARKILKGFKGYIMCDGYQVYDSLKKEGKNREPAMDVTIVACTIHILREFKDCLRSMDKDDCLLSSAQKAVNMLQAIHHADNQWDDLSPDERKEKRLEVLKPLLDAFFAFIDEEKQLVLPKCTYGEAVKYAYNQKEKVYNALLDGRLEIENQKAERCVKPFVIGRKNFLFANTPGGADVSCVDYSIVETAKLNSLNPYEYIKYLLEKLPTINTFDLKELDQLLPWSKTLPDRCRTNVIYNN